VNCKQILDSSYFGKFFAKIKTGGKSNEPSSRMSHNLQTADIIKGTPQTGSRTQAMPSPDHHAQHQDAASTSMERLRENKYMMVDTSSQPRLNNHYGQDELRTPGTKPTMG